MNETLQVIKDRYSCRAFDAKPVGNDLLELVALAGVQSPSGSNTQKWRVVVVSDKTLVDEIEAVGLAEIKASPDKSTYDRIQSRGGLLFYGAPVLAVVAVDASSKDLPLLDCGILVENMTIAASSLGLATCICGLAGFAFHGANEEYFYKKLKFPPNFKLGMSILIGYEKERGKPHEPDLTKITYIK